jgi:glucose-6-phosphate isomerase
MASSRTKLPAWQALEQHRRAIEGVHLRRLFEQEPARFERFSLRLGDILLDYSKQLVTEETVRLLFALARECDLDGWVKRMFSGERINVTENRAALHVALRAAQPVLLEGRDVTRDVKAVTARMRELCEGVRSGAITGAAGCEPRPRNALPLEC